MLGVDLSTSNPGYGPVMAGASGPPESRRIDVNADFTAEELAFEGEVREFLSSEFPSEYRNKADANIRLSKDELVNWQKVNW